MSQTPQGPLQPWLHELVVAVDGHGTALGRAHGQMTGAGAEGFYVDDARVLSVLALELGGEEPAFVGGSARGGSADFLGSARGLGDDGPDPSVEVARRRRVAGSTLTERIEVRSRAAHEVRTRVALRLGGDGAELADVKQGVVDGTGLHAATTSGDGGPLVDRAARRRGGARRLRRGRERAGRRGRRGGRGRRAAG